VRPPGARSFRLVGFASQSSAKDWVRTRVAREERHLPATATTAGAPAAVDRGGRLH
jgi:hypothetical protein